MGRERGHCLLLRGDCPVRCDALERSAPRIDVPGMRSWAFSHSSEGSRAGINDFVNLLRCLSSYSLLVRPYAASSASSRRKCLWGPPVDSDVRRFIVDPGSIVRAPDCFGLLMRPSEHRRHRRASSSIPSISCTYSQKLLVRILPLLFDSGFSCLDS